MSLKTWTTLDPALFNADRIAYPPDLSVSNVYSLPSPQNPQYPSVQFFADIQESKYQDSYFSGIGQYPEAPLRTSVDGSDVIGPIYRKAGFSQRSVPLGAPLVLGYPLQSSVRGIGVTCMHGGFNPIGNGTNSQFSVFYHSQRGYYCSTEFGFFRATSGTGGFLPDRQMHFYYGVYENSVAGGTYVNGITEPVEQHESSSLFLINMDYQWRYEAEISDDLTNWVITVRVADPALGTVGTINSQTMLSVQPWFSSYAAEMRNGAGLTGYVTCSSLLNSGPPFTESGAPYMTVSGIHLPRYV